MVIVWVMHDIIIHKKKKKYLQVTALYFRLLLEARDIESLMCVHGVKLRGNVLFCLFKVTVTQTGDRQMLFKHRERGPVR